MKKSILAATIGLLVVALATSLAFAAAPTEMHGFANNQVNMTNEQKQELAPLFNQMNDLKKQMFEVRKQIIQKQVEFGNLTQEQADQRITRMQDRTENSAAPGMMYKGRMHGNHGCYSESQPSETNH